MTEERRNLVTVTYHAVLRFLERHSDIDVACTRRLISEACQRGAEVGAPVVRVANARFLLRGHTVITCYPADVRLSFDGLARLMREARR